MTVPNYTSGPTGPPPGYAGPPPGYAGPPPARMGRGPKVLLWVGGVLTVLGSLAFIVGFVVMGASLFDSIDEGLDPVSKMDLVVANPGEGTVVLEPDRYQLVAMGPTLTAVSGRTSDAGGRDVGRLPFADPRMEVTGPDGEEVPLAPPSIDRVASLPGLDTVSLREFTVTTSGEYTLTVGGEPGPVTQVGIGEARSLWEEAGGVLVGVVVVVVGSLVASFGFLLLVVGFVWWLVRRSSTASPTTGGGPYPPAPPPYQPPPPPPPPLIS